MLTLSLCVLTAENFLEGNKHDVTTQRKLKDTGLLLLNHLFRHIEYLFLPLQTIMKAQMMMQMSAMQTPTVIPVIDFWSKW